MATGVPFYAFTTEMAAGTHANFLNADSHTVKVALFDDAPVQATDTVIGDQSSEANGGATSNGYTAGGDDVTNAASTAAGVITVDSSGGGIVWTATGDWSSDFQYAVMYNDDATDKLIAYWDYASHISLLNTETFSFVVTDSFLTIGPA